MLHFEAGHPQWRLSFFLMWIQIWHCDWQGLIQIKHPEESVHTFFGAPTREAWSSHFWHSLGSSFSSRLANSYDITQSSTGRRRENLNVYEQCFRTGRRIWGNELTLSIRQFFNVIIHSNCRVGILCFDNTGSSLRQKYITNEQRRNVKLLLHSWPFFTALSCFLEQTE